MPLCQDLPPTVSEQAELLRTRRVSPVELTRTYLERIERLQPVLNVYITVTAGQALAEARAAEAEIAAGNYRGPLHGIPVSYKDIIATAGVRTTSGSRLLADHEPAADAVVVAALRAQGAICLGKTNLHEFAFGITSQNEHFGGVRNPHNPERIPGGSSGGAAAAVAAGLCAAALGSDTGGSIRIPAAACGCVGLKPTYDRVSRRGVTPLSWSLDHVGPITRTVRDAALLLDALSDAAPVAPALAAGPRRARLGVCPGFFAVDLHAEVERAVTRALRRLEETLGAAREVAWPSLEHSALVGTVIAFAEAASYHEPWLRTRPEDYSREVRQRLRLGLTFSAADYLRCQRLRQKMLQEAHDVFRRVDLLVYPTLPFAGAAIGAETVDVGTRQEDVRTASLRYNRPANLTGYPAVSVPYGTSSDGMPIGVQLLARPGQEELLLRAARLLEL